MQRPVILIGAGGHARVVADALRRISVKILGYTDVKRNPAAFEDLLYLGSDNAIEQHDSLTIQLVNGVGSLGLNSHRKALFDRFKRLGYSFVSVVHPSAVVGSGVVLHEGVQLMAGVIVQPGCRIGANCILNSSASVDHDCEIGAHSHIAPGVTLSGGVSVGAGTHVGTGANIIQGVRIGTNCVVGAGALVLKDVPDNLTVFGVPARVLAK